MSLTVEREKKPTLAERIVARLESDLTDRRGMIWEEAVDGSMKEEVRDEWDRIIDEEIREAFEKVGITVGDL